MLATWLNRLGGYRLAVEVLAISVRRKRSGVLTL